MCGIVGISLKDVNWEDIQLIERLILEVSIRGLHATGISWVEDDSIKTIKEPIPASEFLRKYSIADCVEADGSLHLIAHCRYSTSNLDYNQPIAHNYLALVHNGVVTQELPENWHRLYGITCETKNDSEFLFHSQKPLETWLDASIAALELNSGGTLIAYRNGKRPLHLTVLRDGSYIFCSTRDAVLRAGGPESTIVKPYIYHIIYINGHYDHQLSLVTGEDLQQAGN